MAKGKTMHGRVRVFFGPYPDCLSSDVSDEVNVELSDYSEERLEAFLGNVNDRIRKAWNYLRIRDCM